MPPFRVSILAGVAAVLASALAATAQPVGQAGGGGTDAQIRLNQGGGVGGGSGGGGQRGALVSTVRPADTIRIMKNAGFSKIEPYKFNDEDHVLAEIDGTGTFIWHENCKEGACATLWFMVNVGQQDLAENWINSYNSIQYYSRAYLNKNGELIITMGAPLANGVSEEHIAFLGSLWVKLFKEALEFKPAQ